MFGENEYDPLQSYSSTSIDEQVQALQVSFGSNFVVNKLTNGLSVLSMMAFLHDLVNRHAPCT